jgi:RHS repeat-associated protein
MRPCEWERRNLVPRSDSSIARTAHRTESIGFGGQWGNYTDSETNLLSLGHRYYDPNLGRFLTRDPTGYGGGPNLYAFCGGNPVNEMDPEGTNEIIIYGADQKRSDKYFLDAAEALRGQYNAHHPGEKAYIFSAKGMLGNTIHGQDVWKYALTHVTSIDAITYVGHAGITNSSSDPTTYMSKLFSGWDIGHDLTTADVAGLPTTNVKPKARIFLFGCATAARKDPVSGDTLSLDQESMAQAFANHFRTNVQGFTQHVGFGTYGEDWLIRNYDVYHDKDNEVYPVTITPK